MFATIVAADGSETPTAITWISDNTISTAAVALGSTLRVNRFTPKEAPLANFVDGAIVSEANLDTNSNQAVFIAAEATDASAEQGQTLSGINVESLRGIPGGNVESVGLFAALTSLPALPGTNRVRTSGHGETGTGSGAYDRWAAPMAALTSSGQDHWWKQTTRGDIWFLSPHQPLTFEMFGGRGDFNPDTHAGTDNKPAMLALLAYLVQFSVLSDDEASKPYYHASCHVLFRGAGYLFSDTIFLNDVCYNWTGQLGAPYGGGTVFYFASGKTGIVINNNATAGENGIKADDPPSAHGSSFTGIKVYSLGGVVGGTNDGWRVKALVRLTDCGGMHFARHGLNLEATYGSPDGLLSGNTNVFRIIGGDWMNNYGDGIHIAGADANAGTLINVSCIANKGFGIWGRGYLGNLTAGHHIDQNGFGQAGPWWLTTSERLVSTQCHFNGRRYYLVYGQAAAARTTAPSGSSADNACWEYMETNGPHADYPTWVSGMTWRDGGPGFNDNPNGQNTYIGGHIDGDPSIPVRLGPADVTFGGYFSVKSKGGCALWGSGNNFQTRSGINNISLYGGTTMNVTFASSNAPGMVFSLDHATLAPAGHQFQVQGGALVLTYAGTTSDAFQAIRFELYGALRAYSRPSATPIKYIAVAPNGIVMGDVSSGRLMRYAAAPPAGTDYAPHEVCWNDGTNSTYAAVDYWIFKASAWVARP